MRSVADCYELPAEQPLPLVPTKPTHRRAPMSKPTGRWFRAPNMPLFLQPGFVHQRPVGVATYMAGAIEGVPALRDGDRSHAGHVAVALDVVVFPFRKQRGSGPGVSLLFVCFARNS